MQTRTQTLPALFYNVVELLSVHIPYMRKTGEFPGSFA